MRIKFLLQLEKERSTKNNHFFKDYRRQFLSFYNGLFQNISNYHVFEFSQAPG